MSRNVLSGEHCVTSWKTAAKETSCHDVECLLAISVFKKCTSAANVTQYYWNIQQELQPVDSSMSNDIRSWEKMKFLNDINCSPFLPNRIMIIIDILLDYYWLILRSMWDEAVRIKSNLNKRPNIPGALVYLILCFNSIIKLLVIIQVLLENFSFCLLFECILLAHHRSLILSYVKFWVMQQVIIVYLVKVTVIITRRILSL